MSLFLEKKFEKAVQDGVVPGVVLLAKNSSGTLDYSRAFGKRSLREGQNAEPLKTNSAFAIASMTKLLTSIAAMQIVERGLISLEDDVSPLVPELAEKKIILGFDEDGKPQFKDRVNPLKFRFLLTHSAGASYQMQDPKLQKYSAYLDRSKLGTAKGPAGQPSVGTLSERFFFPLCYEPGTAWDYGCGIDWAGRVIEKLTGDTLEDYMQKNIFHPLGVKRITFWPHKHPDIESRMTGMTRRDEKTGLLADYTGPFVNDGATDCLGGQGCYADLEDYMKITHSLLVSVTREDNEETGVPRLLQRQTALQMFQPRLTAESQDGLTKITKIPERVKLFVGYLPNDAVYNWGIGGLLVQSGRPDDDDQEKNRGCRRKSGTMIWSGMPNCYWFIDPASSLTGVFGTYVLPSADPPIHELLRDFEEGIYDLAAASSEK